MSDHHDGIEPPKLRKRGTNNSSRASSHEENKGPATSSSVDALARSGLLSRVNTGQLEAGLQRPSITDKWRRDLGASPTAPAREPSPSVGSSFPSSVADAPVSPTSDPGPRRSVATVFAKQTADPSLIYQYTIEPMRNLLDNWTPLHTELTLATIAVLGASATAIGAPLKAMPEGPENIVRIGTALKQVGVTLEGVANAIELVNQLFVAKDANVASVLSSTLGVVGFPAVGVGEEGPAELDENAKWGVLIAGTIAVTLSRIAKIPATVYAHRISQEKELRKVAKEIGDIAGELVVSTPVSDRNLRAAAAVTTSLGSRTTAQPPPSTTWAPSTERVAGSQVMKTKKTI